MVITKITKNNEDGSVEAKLQLSEEQTAYLLNFAIGMLVNAGIATVVEVDEQEQQQDVIEVVGDAPTPETDNGEDSTAGH